MKIQFTKNSVSTSILFIEGKINRFQDGSLHIGYDEIKKLTTRKLRTLIRKAVRVAKEYELSDIQFDAKNIPNPEKLSEEELGRLVAENSIMAMYEFSKYKTKEEGTYSGLETISFINAESTFKKGAEVGEIVAEEVNRCRDLANTPGGDMTPSVLAQAAKDAAEGTEIKVTILEKNDVEKLKMGLILGVDKASAEPLKFIVMEYWGAEKTKTPIVLVGKGITFDTGGLNLKPTNGITGMHRDMSGGAAVIAAITAAAKLTLKQNIVALIPAVENAISGSALRPGDVLTAMNGKTVEIANTDAEGRLVVADALTYAERYTPQLVIDVATLTGAATVAVGKRMAPILTRNKDLQEQLEKIGGLSGDYVWPLPLWEEYEADIQSDVADMLNTETPQMVKAGGSILGGIFLAQFANNFPRWAHIDIASRDDTISEDYLAPRATGVGVRLLVRLLEDY